MPVMALLHVPDGKKSESNTGKEKRFANSLQKYIKLTMGNSQFKTLGPNLKELP